MRKFETKDGKTLSIRIKDEEAIKTLNNIIPRLTYEEILDGRLEEKLAEYHMDPVEISSVEDHNSLAENLARFNSIPKPSGV